MKSGFVAILGRPNVGKSTLINSILNHKVSIVTDKSQTTRENIKGIYNSENAQIIFVDTPGIHKPHQKLGQEMNSMAYSAAHDVDAAILVVDVSKPFGEGDEFILNHLDINNTKLFIILNKIDLARIDKVEELKKIYKDNFIDKDFNVYKAKLIICSFDLISIIMTLLLISLFLSAFSHKRLAVFSLDTGKIIY